MMTCCEEIHIRTSELTMAQEDDVINTKKQGCNSIMRSLLKTRLFQNFFGTLGFILMARKAATMYLYNIVEK